MRFAVHFLALLVLLSTGHSFADDAFFLMSGDDGGLYFLEQGETAELIGILQPESDLSGLVNFGDFLLTLDRGSNEIITIDKSTAAIVSEVPLDVDVFITRRGIAVNESGVVFGIFDGNQLRTVNTTTGATNLVAVVSGAERIEALAFGIDGTLFAAGSEEDDLNSENVYTLNIDTGVLELIGATGVTDLDALTVGQDGMLYGCLLYTSPSPRDRG